MLSLSCQLTNLKGPVPTGVRSTLPPLSWIDFGETIRPIRLVRMFGRPAFGRLSFSVTWFLPVTSTLSTEAISAFTFDRGSFL